MEIFEVIFGHFGGKHNWSIHSTGYINHGWLGCSDAGGFRHVLQSKMPYEVLSSNILLGFISKTFKKLLPNISTL